MPSAQLIEKVWCTVLSSFILFGDTIHLIYPVLESKRPDLSQMKRIYGPLCGMPHMDKIDAFLVSAMLIPAGYVVWIPSSRAALASNLGLATAQPFLLLVASSMSACDLMEHPLAPLGLVAVSFSFGLYSLAYRLVSYDAYMFDLAYVPMLVVWHVICSAIALAAYIRIKDRIPTLQSTIELEKLKRTAFNNGSEWPKDARSPVGLEETRPLLLEQSENELKNITIISPLSLVGCVLVLGIYLAFSIIKTNHDNLGNITPFKYVTFPLMVFETVATVIIVLNSSSRRNNYHNTATATTLISDDENNTNPVAGTGVAA